LLSHGTYIFGAVVWWQGLTSLEQCVPCSHRGLRHTAGFLVAKACSCCYAIYWESCLTITSDILFLGVVLVSLIGMPCSVYLYVWYLLTVSICLPLWVVNFKIDLAVCWKMTNWYWTHLQKFFMLKIEGFHFNSQHETNRMHTIVPCIFTIQCHGEHCCMFWSAADHHQWTKPQQYHIKPF
jgi:hypothetical protein